MTKKSNNTDISTNNINKSNKVKDVFSKGGFSLFWFLLKWSFLFMLAIWVFRMAFSFGVDAITFTDLLSYIKNCPDYFSLFIENVLSNVIFVGSTDSVNLPIFGALLEFLQYVLAILVYVFGCIWSGFRYLSYFFDVIFIP